MKKTVLNKIILLAAISTLVFVGFLAQRGIAVWRAKTQDARYLRDSVNITRAEIPRPSLFSRQAILFVDIANTGTRDIYQLTVRITYFDARGAVVQKTEIDVLKDSFSSIEKESKKTFKISLNPQEYPYQKEVARCTVEKYSCLTLKGS